MNEYKNNHGSVGWLETDEEREKAIFEDLESKSIIEQHLEGKVVRHLCYPWWEGSELALNLSKKAGNVSNFWGCLPNRRINKVGDDP